MGQLFEKLNNINRYNEKTESNEWATDYGIRQTLNDYLGSIAHIIDPRLSSIFSPLEADANRAREGAINYAKMIAGYTREDNGTSTNGILHQDGGVLTKPLVMILNATSIYPGQVISGVTEGGSHWVACVVLPKRYKTPLGKTINNDKEQIVYIDSLCGYTNPTLLIRTLTKENEEKIQTKEGVTTTHHINACFPNAAIRIFDQQLQKEGSDCGWWAVYNACMLVLTGDMDYLKHFKEPSRKPAYALRHIFSRLAEREVYQKSNAYQFAEIDEEQYRLPERPKSKDRRKAEFITNIIAVSVVAIGAFVAFSSSIITSMGWSVGTLVSGLIIGGVGLLPRIIVELQVTKDTRDNEQNTKDKLLRQIEVLKYDGKEQEKLSKTYKLQKSGKTKWVNFTIKLLAVIFGYVAAGIAASILKFEQTTTSQDKKSDYLAIRFVLSGASIIITALLALTSLILENRTKKGQLALDELEKRFESEIFNKRLAAHEHNSQGRILQMLGIDSSFAKEIIERHKKTDEDMPLRSQEKTAGLKEKTIMRHSEVIKTPAQEKATTHTLEQGQGTELKNMA